MYIEPRHIKELRGLRTQEEFADEINYHRVTLAIWETTGRISKRAARHLVDEHGLDRRYVLPKAPAPTGTGADLSERGAA